MELPLSVPGKIKWIKSVSMILNPRMLENPNDGSLIPRTKSNVNSIHWIPSVLTLTGILAGQLQ